VDEGKEAASMSDALKAFKEVEGSDYSPQWARKGAKALLIIEMTGDREVVAHMISYDDRWRNVYRSAIFISFPSCKRVVICDK